MKKRYDNQKTCVKTTCLLRVGHDGRVHRRVWEDNRTSFSLLEKQCMVSVSLILSIAPLLLLPLTTIVTVNLKPLNPEHKHKANQIH